LGGGRAGARVDGLRAGEGLVRALVVSGAEVGEAQVEPRLGRALVLAGRGEELTARALEVLLPVQRHAEVVVRLGRARVQLQRALEGPDGARDVPFPEQEDPQV